LGFSITGLPQADFVVQIAEQSVMPVSLPNAYVISVLVQVVFVSKVKFL